MLTNIRYILLTALRDRLFAGLFVGLVAAVVVSSFMGNTAMVEPQQMTLIFSAAASRFILAIGLIVFTCFHLRTAFETREIDVLLSRPIARSSLVLSYWCGFAVVATILVAVAAGVMLLAGWISKPGYALWTASLLAEMWLVVAMSLFAAFTLKSAVSSVLATLAMYTLSRMTGFFIATAQSKFLFKDRQVDDGMRWMAEAFAMVVPRLDLFTKSSWLLYGVEQAPDFYLFAVQSMIFIPLLLVASMIDFKRKQF